MWKAVSKLILAPIGLSYAYAQFGRLLDGLGEQPNMPDKHITLCYGAIMGAGSREKEHWRKATLWEEVTRVPT